MKGYQVTWFIVGVALGALIGYEHATSQDTAELQREASAYRMCMLTAALHRCEMTPQDFVRYWEIKHLLEEREENE